MVVHVRNSISTTKQVLAQTSKSQLKRMEARRQKDEHINDCLLYFHSYLLPIEDDKGGDSRIILNLSLESILKKEESTLFMHYKSIV